MLKEKSIFKNILGLILGMLSIVLVNANEIAYLIGIKF